MSTNRTQLIDSDVKVENLEYFYKAPTTSFRAWGHVYYSKSTSLYTL